MIGEPAGGDWRERAVCTAVDPEIFYPLDLAPTAMAVARAKRICTGCVVRSVCLLDAMAGEDPARRWGVIGATTPAERDALFASTRMSVAGPRAVAA